ncbi:MAG: sialate O-acetylesterase, partial [Bacteroidota bacterium]|nr:sialate O-acetylesterase [Bacteroidota bacterium]
MRNHKMRLKILLVVCITLQFTTIEKTFSQIKLPSVFCNNMVLQQRSDVPIWGWDAPGNELTIKTSWDTTTVKVRCANTAFWKTTLKTPSAGGPYTITIKGSDEQTLSNVMIGEVWICSGQSNMEMNSTWGIKKGDEEVKNADYPNIRFFSIKKIANESRQINCYGKWEECTPATMKNFSAAGYFFGKQLQDSLKVPIGLINISWGGAPAECFINKELITNDYTLTANARKLKEYPWWPSLIGGIYNAMIYPIIPYQIAGAIWYQGESNVTTANGYNKLLKTLIENWRADFGNNFPFYFVQIAPYTYEKDVNAAFLREAQLKSLEVPNTGMVVTTDLVDNIKDIHPKDKKSVGIRLANLALSDHYGIKGIICKSPVYKSMKIEKNRIRIFFDNVPTKLISKNGAPSCLEIAGEDHKFVPAQGVIDKNTLVVFTKDIKNPVAVRFSFT